MAEVAREVIHLALAAYMADSPDEQVLTLAKKIKRTTLKPSIKRAAGVVLKYDRFPALLAMRVYWEEVESK